MKSIIMNLWRLVRSQSGVLSKSYYLYLSFVYFPVLVYGNRKKIITNKTGSPANFNDDVYPLF